MTEGPTSSFGFAFFGAEPSDWFDLTDDLFSYELRFEKAPDAAARATIAAAWEEGINARSIEIARPFVWADRWALVRVRPAGWNRASIVEMARSVQEALRRVHEAWPLEEATLAEALESESDWDAWSIAERGAPTTGPRWPVELPKTGADERFKAASEEDAGAERAREEVRAAKAERAAAARLEGPAGDEGDEGDEGDDEGDGSSKAREDAPRVTEGDISITRPDAAEVPRKIEVLPSQHKLFGSRAETAVTLSGRVFGVGKPARKPKQAAFLEDGELQPIAGDPLPDAYAGYLAAREDGEAALVGFDFNSVWEIDFAERRIRLLFKHGESLADLAYGPDGRVIVLTSDSLDVHRREGDGVTLERRWSIDGYGVRSARGGRLLFVSCFEGDDGITIFGFSGDSLRRLARVVFSVSEILVSDGRVFLEDLGEDGRAYVEVAGLDELLARLDASPEAFAEAPVNTEALAEPSKDEESEDESDGDGDDDDDGDGDGDDDGDGDGDDDGDGDGDDDDGDGDDNDDASDGDDDEDSDSDDDDDDSDDDDEDERPPVRKRNAMPVVTVDPSPGKVGLVRAGRGSPIEEPDEPDVPRDVKRQFGTGSEVKVTPDGSLYYGWKKEGRRSFRFAALVQGHFVETDATAKSASTEMSVSWDKRWILARSDGDKKLWSIELPEGRATLVHDFSGEKYDDEVFWCLPLAYRRVFVSTSNDVWIFSLGRGAPELEMRGEFVINEAKVVSDGRAIVIHTSDRKTARVWGVFEDGIRELASFGLAFHEILEGDGRVVVRASGGAGWFELLGIGDAWETAKREGAGPRYPRVELKKDSSDDDDDDDDDDENDDDNDGDDDDS